MKSKPVSEVIIIMRFMFKEKNSKKKENTLIKSINKD